MDIPSLLEEIRLLRLELKECQDLQKKDEALWKALVSPPKKAGSDSGG